MAVPAAAAKRRPASGAAAEAEVHPSTPPRHLGRSSAPFLDGDHYDSFLSSRNLRMLTRYATQALRNCGKHAWGSVKTHLTIGSQTAQLAPLRAGRVGSKYPLNPDHEQGDYPASSSSLPQVNNNHGRPAASLRSALVARPAPPPELGGEAPNSCSPIPPSSGTAPMGDESLWSGKREGGLAPSDGS